MTATATTPPLIIPTVSDQADYTMRCRLDGKDYGLHFLWNQSESRWYLAVYDDADNLLVASIKLVTNWPLLRFYQSDPDVPPGELVVIDLSSDGSPPQLSDFGVGLRCQLTYVPATALT